MTRVANNLKTVLAYAWTAFLLLFSIDVAAVPERPEPARFVNDLALMFDHSQAETLESRLAVYSDTTTTQIVVVTVPDLEGQDAASYATELGINWQIGSEKFDNGVVILIKPKNDNGSGEVFIAVGYGLEGAIPDAYAKRIIEEIMIPKFKEDDYFGAVNAACQKIILLADGEEFDVAGQDDGGDMMWLLVILGVIVLIYFLSPKMKGNGGGPGSGTTSGGGPVVPPVSRGFGGSSSGGGRSFGGGSFGGAGAGGKW